jgi:hypothetical protein
MTKTPSRADYMSGRCSHQDYYRALNKTLGLRLAPDAAILPRVRGALANGDEHLNTITLATWDRMAAPLLSLYGLSTADAFRAHGDGMSQAGLVCCLKQAARDAADATKEASCAQ